MGKSQRKKEQVSGKGGGEFGEPKKKGGNHHSIGQLGKGREPAQQSQTMTFREEKKWEGKRRDLLMEP